jgi:hypothetical protein
MFCTRTLLRRELDHVMNLAQAVPVEHRDAFL